MARGCLWVVGIVVGLAVIGAIYLALNPPLSLPETGYLKTTLERDVELGDGTAVAALRLRVRLDPDIYRGSARFEPLRVAATVMTDGGGSHQLRIYPLGAEVPDGLLLEEHGASASWEIDCEPAGDVPADESLCEREFLVLVGGDVDARLEVVAEQRFPPHVPTPFLVSIDVAAEQHEVPAGASLKSGDAAGSLTLGSEEAVATFDVELPGPATTGGTRLVAEASPARQPIPAGLDAPAPIRLALLDRDGRVVGHVGVRPGTTSVLALPPLSGSHRLVAWWQDIVDQAYAVTWRLEAGQVAVGAPSMVTSRGPDRPASHGGAPGEGREVVTNGVHGTFVALGVPETEFAQDDGRLPARLGVLHLRLLAEGSADVVDPVAVLLTAERWQPEDGVPIVLTPDRVHETAVSTLGDCSGSRCGPWGIAVRGGREGQQVALSWTAELRYWPLDPGPMGGSR